MVEYDSSYSSSKDFLISSLTIVKMYQNFAIDLHKSHVNQKNIIPNY